MPVSNAALWRLVALAIGSFVFVSFAPSGFGTSYRGTELAVGLFLAAVLAVLLQQSLVRRRELHAVVYLELNKVRRIYHLAKNLALASPRFRSWFTDLHTFVHDYLGSYDKGALDQYRNTNASFRKLSYHIYTIPELETNKENALYSDLLKTTGVVAESRQRVKDLVVTRLSSYTWIAVLLLTVAYAVTVVAATGGDAVSRLVAGLELAAALFAVDLLWELDTLRSDLSAWAQRYVDNIAKLEYRREENHE
ncbi:MAG: hypothetical protein PHT12_00110 [Patescibacteria group bacterium]|nr:hypothetical protein [Patescibacteria group bacterium]